MKACYRGDNMLFFGNKKRWKLYLYLNNICIKKLYIDDEIKPKEEIFVINVWFKRNIFNSNHIKTVVRPTKLIYTDMKKRETHWEFEYEKGIDI